MSPKIVDAIYRNRENRRFCKEHGIRMSGPGLGRPPKPTQENEAELRALADQARQDELDRIPVEGKFGEGKRRYGLGRVMTKLACTSETGIMLTFLVMNLKKMAGRHFFAPVFRGEHERRWSIWERHGKTIGLSEYTWKATGWKSPYTSQAQKHACALPFSNFDFFRKPYLIEHIAHLQLGSCGYSIPNRNGFLTSAIDKKGLERQGNQLKQLGIIRKKP